MEKLLLSLLWTVLGALGSLVGWVVYAYNTLVNARRRADEALANVGTQIKRRYDLIPNLAETVKGYASHEREVLEKVTQARSFVAGAKTVTEYQQADNMITGALKTLFAVSENYPDLKASQNFLELQGELAETENRIQEGRRVYNEAVRDVNVKIESIPINFVAVFFRFKKADFFEITAAEKEVPKIKF
ncbi:MAG: LemA family protein [Candidatus Taylorbacteria bacterium]|nr:LemA family protein [Candidatus Taylorbacteria bacterium]